MKMQKAFGPEPASIRDARRFVTEALRGADAEVSDAVALLVSELATNSIIHAVSGFTVVLRVGSRGLRVAVTDRGNGSQAPLAKSPTEREPTGRGLQIVARIADEWGIRTRRAGGSTVWFTIRTAAPLRLSGARSSVPSNRTANEIPAPEEKRVRARLGSGPDRQLSFADVTM